MPKHTVEYLEMHVKEIFDEMNPWEAIDLMREEIKKKIKPCLNKPVSKKVQSFVDFVIAEMSNDFGIDINADIPPICYAANAELINGGYTIPLEGLTDTGGAYFKNANVLIVAYTDKCPIVDGFKEYSHYAHAPLIGSINEDIPFSRLFNKIILHEIAHFWASYYFNTRAEHGREFRFSYGMLMQRYGTVDILA